MRKRLVETSAGPVEIEISANRVHGLWVSITPFAESGWQSQPTKAWTSNQSEGETLSQFLTRFVPLPEAEAAQLAVDVQGAWRQQWAKSGGEVETRSMQRWINVSLSAATAIVLLALVGIGLVVWLIVT
jgi:hypothetical protein